MLTIIVPETEFFDETTSKIFKVDSVELDLEHSLVSLSKWESRFLKPFLSTDSKTPYEILSYAECMILNPKYPKDIVARFTQENLDSINEYIESKQTATTFGDLPPQNHRRKGETITSELIYYWMVAFNIPPQYESWHLNRLFALVRICNLKNAKPTKRSKAEIAKFNREENARRRAEYGTSG